MADDLAARSPGWHATTILMVRKDGKVVIGGDGQVSEVRLVAGQSYRRPAGIEHDVMNGSDQPMAFVEIEVKQPADLS